MSPRRKVPIRLRKLPKQARSTELMAIVLEAAAQVLAKEGAQRFTTARVAARAGVSVGSLYQYFPNKASILFRLQLDEWRQTAELLRSILQDAAQPPMQRLRALVHAFIRSECDEAVMRIALGDAAPLYRDAPEGAQAKAAGADIVQVFIDEVLPRAPAAVRSIAGNLVETTLDSVGRSFSESSRTAIEIETFAEALADMLCAYLSALQPRNLANSAMADERRSAPKLKKVGRS